MRNIQIAIVSLMCIGAAGACVTEPGEGEGEGEEVEASTSTETSELEVVATPICADIVDHVWYFEGCQVQGLNGSRKCTDRIVIDRAIKLLPSGGWECQTVGIDITTTCGPCNVLPNPF